MQPHKPEAHQLTDVRKLRERARQKLEDGAVTPAYGADRAAVLSLLNAALATELVCVLRYRRHYHVAAGFRGATAAEEFLEHAVEEQQHADRIAQRIVQLGGKPDFDPEGLQNRSHSEYKACDRLDEMVRENLINERVAIESYTEMIRFIGEGDPTTRRLLEEILAKEEEHADDMADLLRVVDEGG